MHGQALKNTRLVSARRRACAVRPVCVAVPGRTPSPTPATSNNALPAPAPLSKAASSSGAAAAAAAGPVFVDRDGKAIRVMACDYGFRSGAGRLYQDRYGEVPGSIVEMAVANFKHELAALRASFRFNEYEPLLETAHPVAKVFSSAGNAAIRALARADAWLEARKALPPLERPLMDAALAGSGDAAAASAECREIRDKLAGLQLSDAAVWAREEKRKAAGEGVVPAPWWIKLPFWALCVVLDGLYANRPIQRFWVLETVARIPYFSAISLLHLYESLGFWRAGAELRKVHFAEEWNELHHLQIMEALGGDLLWFDRFVAEHAALLYYWVCLGLYMAAPRHAYQFSELVEWHAVDTYSEFLSANAGALRALPPPRVAAAYYRDADLYMFDAMAAGGAGAARAAPRRPPCDTLYDVFANIRDDEVEHVATMRACQSPAIAVSLAAWRRANGGGGGGGGSIGSGSGSDARTPADN